MSYLHLPRLTFTGDFKSDVSTVNNDPAHYNNQTFQPSFQQFGLGSTNGWWNPEGGASFSFLNCRVRQITLPDGTTQTEPAKDIIVGQPVGDFGDRATGKMVDLDPQEQGSSELWAVTLRIGTADDELLLRGDVRPTAFRDLQLRQQTGAKVNGQPLGGTWTTVLTNIEWGKKSSDSPFLEKLRDATDGDRLSLNLQAYGYYYAHAADGRFSLGRIIGALGPWLEGEPELFAPARRLYGILNVGTTKRPAVFFSNSNFLFENCERRLTLDLGGSFPIADAMGTITQDKKYVIAVSKKPVAFAPSTTPQTLVAGDFTTIGDLNYTTGDWLDKTGGIVALDNLSDDVAGALENNQLLLLTPSSNNDAYVIIAREAIDGYLVRAENFVQRLDSDCTNEVRLYAYQYGEPLDAANIAITLEPPTPIEPVGPDNPICEVPGNNYPPEGLSFSGTVTTNPDGGARLSITGNAIENPRGYIDGQIYTLDYQLQDIPNDPAQGRFSNDVIFVHLRDHFEIPKNPAWFDIAEIMNQFGNLYPIMSKYIVDLSDPVAVKNKKDILTFAFTRPIHDSLHMPVTRDLSDAKRQTILKWLESPDIEKTGEAKTFAAAPESVRALAESPADPGSQLTDRQTQLKNAVRAKNGSIVSFDEIENLFEDL
jgi:hypothetical protein